MNEEMNTVAPSTKWARANKELHNQRSRNWQKKNPEKYRKNHLISKERYYSGWERATMRYERWGDVDDCLIIERAFTDKQLSDILGRSVRAIQIRRCKLKLQDEREKS